MSKEINEAKFHGFQLGIQIAEYLSQQQRPITLMEAIGIMRDIADGNLTLTDPENSGLGFDSGTAKVVRDVSLGSITWQQRHALDARERLNSIHESTKDA